MEEWVFGGMKVWVFGVWKSGCLGVWKSGCLGYGRVGVWRYESVGVWVNLVVCELQWMFVAYTWVHISVVSFSGKCMCNSSFFGNSN